MTNRPQPKIRRENDLTDLVVYTWDTSHKWNQDRPNGRLCKRDALMGRGPRIRLPGGHVVSPTLPSQSRGARISLHTSPGSSGSDN